MARKYKKRATVPAWDRLMAKVRVDESGCWIFTGCISGTGYGDLGTGGRNGHESTHRISYKHNHGPIPDGMVVRHKCDVRACVNPDHLELGTYKDNSRDMVERGRASANERSHFTKLSQQEVRQIRAEFVREFERNARGNWRSNSRELAAKYGVSMGHISDIGRGAVRRHVSG